MRHLQLDPLAADIGPILASIELERLAWRKHQRHESSPIRRVVRALAFAFPFPNEGRNTLIGTFISQLHQIGVHQLGRPALLARFALIRNQPSCQLSGIRIQLARTIRRLKRRFDNSLP
jgi:hypothetical protein